MFVRYSATLTALALSLTLPCGIASALDVTSVGPRATGMGGAGVACADDYVAQYYNPGILGFFEDGDAAGARYASDNNDLQRKDWGMGVDATGGGRSIGNLSTYINDVLKIDVHKLETLGQSGNTDISALENTVTALQALSQFSPDSDGILIDFNGGGGLRIMNVVLGARVYANAVGKVQHLDLTNLGIALPSGATVADAISDINYSVPGGYTPSHLTSAQQSQITTMLGGPSATVTDAINKLDIAIGKAGVPSSQVQSVVDTLQNVVDSSGSSGSSQLFSKNTTTIRLLGLSVAEIPISYGHSIGEHFSIGGSLKYMLGRVYGQDVKILDTSSDDFGTTLSNTRDHYKQTQTFGIDLGVAARLPYLQVGLTGRNLNAPTFKGPTVKGVKFPDYKLDPQATAGAAFIPFTTLTFAGDIDLTKSDTALQGYQTQYAGAGVEWDAFRVVALRAGIRKDINNQDSKLLYTGGVGVNLYVLRLDVAGQMTTDKVTYDGKDYPSEGRVSFALATDW